MFVRLILLNNKELCFGSRGSGVRISLPRQKRKAIKSKIWWLLSLTGRQEPSLVRLDKLKSNTKCFGFSLLVPPQMIKSELYERIISLPRQNRTSFNFRGESFIFTLTSTLQLPPQVLRPQQSTKGTHKTGTFLFSVLTVPATFFCGHHGKKQLTVVSAEQARNRSVFCLGSNLILLKYCGQTSSIDGTNKAPPCFVSRLLGLWETGGASSE